MHTKCIFCGATVQLVHVHGHYQCPVCKTNALPCCDGDNCDNFLLVSEEGTKDRPGQAAENQTNTGAEGSGC